ncbi:MAG: hypothetical protein IT249_17405 [Chitinophagaceae bacterium]|nr:hypothetical protein [Chitinophagaceae bacterium]
MQTRKIILIVLACFVSALAFLGVLPMHRTYTAAITVNASNTITNRTIADTANWPTWYTDSEEHKGVLKKFESFSEKKHDNFNYTIQNNDDLKNGMIRLTRSNKWNTEITWVEELEINKGLFNKLKLLFNPSQFRKPFFDKIVQFKNHIEHPDSIFGGIAFERAEIPSNKVVIKNDTVTIAEMEDAILKSYNDIIASIPQELVKEPGTFLSQYEKISDVAVALSVAVEINEPEKELKTPFELAELDGYPAVVMHTTKNYKELDADVSIMYEWLKKHNERPATSFWVKHNPGNNIALASPDNKLTIIQEVYSLQ